MRPNIGYIMDEIMGDKYIYIYIYIYIIIYIYNMIMAYWLCLKKDMIQNTNGRQWNTMGYITNSTMLYSNSPQSM